MVREEAPKEPLVRARKFESMSTAKVWRRTLQGERKGRWGGGWEGEVASGAQRNGDQWAGHKRGCGL